MDPPIQGDSQPHTKDSVAREEAGGEAVEEADEEEAEVVEAAMVVPIMHL